MYRLFRYRRLITRKQGNELNLKPQPDLEAQLSTIWRQLPKFKGTKSDSELRATTSKARKDLDL